MGCRPASGFSGGFSMFDTWRRTAQLLLCAFVFAAMVACDSKDTTAEDTAAETEVADSTEAADTADHDEAAVDAAVAEAEAIQPEAASDFGRAEAEAAIIANALEPWK